MLLVTAMLGKQLTDEELASIRPKIVYFNKGIILSATISVDEAEIEKLAKLNALKKIKDDFFENNRLNLSFVYSFAKSYCTEKCVMINNKDYGDKTTTVSFNLYKGPYS